MRASKYQANQYEELHTRLAAISHASDSPTRAADEMMQNPIKGSIAKISSIGTTPCGIVWPVPTTTRAEMSSTSQGVTNIAQMATTFAMEYWSEETGRL